MKLIQRSLHIAYIFPPVVNILWLQVNCMQVAHN